MGNYLFKQYNEVCDYIHDYDVTMTDKETNSNDKIPYYWLGLNNNDLELYQLLEEID
jgi:hypothetical protein